MDVKNVGEINFKNVKNVNFFISMLHTYLSFSDMAFNDISCADVQY